MKEFKASLNELIDEKIRLTALTVDLEKQVNEFKASASSSQDSLRKLLSESAQKVAI